jgi:hypothetical protein
MVFVLKLTGSTAVIRVGPLIRQGAFLREQPLPQARSQSWP